MTARPFTAAKSLDEITDLGRDRLYVVKPKILTAWYEIHIYYKKNDDQADSINAELLVKWNIVT